MSVTIQISEDAYTHLARMARAHGITVPQLIDRATRKKPPQAAQNPRLSEFHGHPLPELPQRPQTPLGAQKAFIVAAAQNGWTTSEILIATNDKGWALTRAFINDTRRRAGFPARKTS